MDNLEDGVSCADLDLRYPKAKLRKIVLNEEHLDHYSDEMYEGGSKKKSRHDKDQDEDNAEAANAIKKVFSKSDPLGKTHIKEVGEEMRGHGSIEKTGFMEKEAKFVKKLKDV